MMTKRKSSLLKMRKTIKENHQKITLKLSKIKIMMITLMSQIVVPLTVNPISVHQERAVARKR